MTRKDPPGDADLPDEVGGPAVRDADRTGPERLPRPLVLACAVIWLEALALAGLGVFLVIDTAAGRSSQVAFGLLSALFCLLGSAVLHLGARGLRRLSPAARTPVVVLQVLALPVAYSMAFQAGLVGLGGPIFVAVLAVLYLLFTPPVRAVLDREPRD